MEIMRRGVAGIPVTAEEVVATFADEKNWRGEYKENPPTKMWVWQGPVMPPWELAQNAIEAAKGEK
jgi:hypothetical protein